MFALLSVDSRLVLLSKSREFDRTEYISYIYEFKVLSNPVYYFVEVISASVLQSDWILGNVRQYGYYRVTYSDENWNKLINQLNEDHTVRKCQQNLISVK